MGFHKMWGEQFGDLKHSNTVLPSEYPLQLLITKNLPLVCRILNNITGGIVTLKRKTKKGVKNEAKNKYKKQFIA